MDEAPDSVRPPGSFRTHQSLDGPETTPRAAKVLPRLIALSFLAWAAASVCAWTVTGILEPATLDVDYFEVGAGNELLLVRGSLAIGIALLAALWACCRGTLRARLLRLALAPCVLWLFFWSVSSLDRTAPGFSQQRFEQIVSAHQAGRPFTIRDVRARLGAPLIIRHDGDFVTYSYTFTPSGGFGWQKRVFNFDPQGFLVDFLANDEP